MRSEIDSVKGIEMVSVSQNFPAGINAYRMIFQEEELIIKRGLGIVTEKVRCKIRCRTAVGIICGNFTQISRLTVPYHSVIRLQVDSAFKPQTQIRYDIEYQIGRQESTIVHAVIVIVLKPLICSGVRRKSLVPHCKHIRR